MICHIDPNNGVPIYEQIVRQVKFCVANGSLQVGERVPSVRDMATKTAVNVNTVARAYRDLQDEGVLQSVRGTGMIVTLLADQICQRERLEMIRQRLASVLREALQNQISVDEIRTMVEQQCIELTQDSANQTATEPTTETVSETE